MSTLFLRKISIDMKRWLRLNNEREEVPYWLIDMVSKLTARPRHMTANQLTARIHDAVVIAEAVKYATPESKFLFHIANCTEADINEVRSHLTDFEQSIVELRKV